MIEENYVYNTDMFWSRWLFIILFIYSFIFLCRFIPEVCIQGCFGQKVANPHSEWVARSKATLGSFSRGFWRSFQTRLAQRTRFPSVHLAVKSLCRRWRERVWIWACACSQPGLLCVYHVGQGFSICQVPQTPIYNHPRVRDPQRQLCAYIIYIEKCIL